MHLTVIFSAVCETYIICEKKFLSVNIEFQPRQNAVHELKKKQEIAVFLFVSCFACWTQGEKITKIAEAFLGTCKNPHVKE